MEEEVLSFLSKLPITDLPLLSNGIRVNESINKIRTRLPNLEPSKQVALGVFLQHIDPSIFTQGELMAVASKRLDLISSNPNQPLERTISKEQGLYDTGSIRTSSQLYDLGIEGYQLNYLIARSTRTIQDLINILEV